MADNIVHQEDVINFLTQEKLNIFKLIFRLLLKSCIKIMAMFAPAHSGELIKEAHIMQDIHLVSY